MARFVTVDGATYFSVVPSRVTGDLDLRAKVACDNWVSTAQTIWDSVEPGVGGYRLAITATGAQNFTAVGSVGTIAEATAAATLVDGEPASLKTTLDVSAGNMIWYQDDAQIDTDTFTAQALGASTRLARVGIRTTNSDALTGDFFYVEARAGVDGTVAARFDADDIYEQVVAV